MKSYFNVPDHINSENRHLGIKKNIRKNKYEPKAKKKHRIARLKFLNNKRNIEIFQMSLNATYEHIELLNQHYYNLMILEEERIQNIELEKQKILQKAELQKQRDIDNFNNTVIIMQKQLDLIPKYESYIEKIIQENAIIEEEKRMMEQMLKSEQNQEIITTYKIYFDEIRIKEEKNAQLILDLQNQQKQSQLYKSYINKRNEQYEKYDSIYAKAIDINNQVIHDKMNMQNLLDKWSSNINQYNEYIKEQSIVVSNYQKEQELLDYEEKINRFKNTFTTLNSQVVEIINNMNHKNNYIDELNDQSQQDIPEVKDIQINETYINYFNTALRDMQSLQKIRADRINELKLIEHQQKEMIYKEQADKKRIFEEKVNDYKSIIEESRKYRENFLVKQQNYIKKQEELAKYREEKRLEDKAIKLKNDIHRFNKSIHLFNKRRDEYIQLRTQEKLKLKEEKERLMIERAQQTKKDNERRDYMEYIKRIENTVQNVYIKKIQEIEDNYKNYQEEILRLEEEKERKKIIEQEKLQNLLDQQQQQRKNLIHLEEEYNNILISKQKKQEEETNQKQREEERKTHILNTFNAEFTRIHTIKLLKAKEELQKREEEIKQQELLEYENQLTYENNIKYYSNLIIENQKSHELFKKSIKEYKEKEIAKLEKIKEEEKFQHNKEIINHSIDYVLDNVYIEIETIEYNKTIEKFDKEINKFQDNIALRKLELEEIKRKKEEDIEYERIQLELYEEEMMNHKKNQEEQLISQMNDMILQFNINTEEHIKYIEKQKHDAELADIKKEEEEKENLRLLEERKRIEFDNSIKLYKNALDKHNEKISHYENIIRENEKKIQAEKEYHEYQQNLEKERLKKLKEQEKKTILDNFNTSIKKYRNQIHILEKKKLDEEEAIIEERKRIEKETLLRQKKINSDYIKYFTQSIETTKLAYKTFIKSQEEAKIKYEKEKQEFLENIEIQKKNKIKKLTSDFKLKFDNIREQELLLEKKKEEQERLIEEEKKQRQIFLQKVENDKKLKMEKLTNAFKDKFANIKQLEELLEKNKADKQRALEEEKKQRQIKSEERKKLIEKKLTSEFKHKFANIRKQKELLEKNKREKERILREYKEEQKRSKINNYNKLVASFENDINNIEKEYQKNINEQEIARKEYEKKQEELLLQQQKEETIKYNKLVASFDNDIVNLEEQHKQRVIENEKAKEEYEKEQKLILLKQEEELLKQEKEKKDKYNKLLSDYENSITELEKQHAQNIINQKLAQEQYEIQQKKLLQQQEKEKQEKYEKLVSSFDNRLINIEEIYNDIKNQESIKQKNIELQKERERQEKKREEEKLFRDLEEQYATSINNINIAMQDYKKQLEKYDDEQAKILKEKEFKEQEEKRLKRKKYYDNIKEYERKITEHNEMIRLKKDEIAKMKLQEEIEHQKLIEKNEKEKIRLQKTVLKKYEKRMNEFYDNQNKLMIHLQEQLKKEKEQEHQERLLKLEKDLNDKIESMDNDDVVKKIDNTINYIKDLNDNKENTDFINKLKDQYDNSYINPDNEKFVDQKDILSVSSNTLTFENFRIYNRYTFNAVPKIIYQTWPTKNLTKNMSWVVNRLRSTHPNFEYHLFDDNDCRTFIKKHFGMETLWAFDRLIPGAFKADLWRYCVMYITGGIYLDIKMCPVNGFRFDYLLKNDWYCNDLARGDGFAGIWQGILVSRPRNPVFKYLINEVINNVKNEFYGDDPLEITGPKMMKRLLNHLKIRVNSPLQIKKYLNKKVSTITNREYKVGICIDEDIECLLEYDEYRQECLRTGVHYAEAWKKNTVYNKSILLENYVSETV